MLGKVVSQCIGVMLMAWVSMAVVAMFLWTSQGYHQAHQYVLDQQTSEEAILMMAHPTLSTQWLGTMTSSMSGMKPGITQRLPSIDAGWWSLFAEIDWITDTLTFLKKTGGELCHLLGSTTRLVILKSIMMLFLLPLLAVGLVTGGIDGWIRRAIRTHEMGRESAFLFHKFSKAGVWLLKGMCWAFYLLPLSRYVMSYAVIISALAAVMMSKIVSHLKKYL